MYRDWKGRGGVYCMSSKGDDCRRDFFSTFLNLGVFFRGVESKNLNAEANEQDIQII